MNIELKDYIAVHALQGMLTHNSKTPFEHLTVKAYHIAEKMIEQKHKLVNDKYVNSSKQINVAGSGV